MEWIAEERREVAGTYLAVSAGKIGDDVLICVEGGNKPHIGCVVQAVPRLSLDGSGKMSATASVLNITGHKDEFLCRKLAEQVCSRLGVTVVCTGGVHLDGISAEQITRLLEACGEIGESMVMKLQKIVQF